MTNSCTDTVSMPREHYNAVRRVLKLVQGYIGDMPNTMHAHKGGLMNIDGLWEQMQAARKLMPAKARKRRG